MRSVTYKVPVTAKQVEESQVALIKGDNRSTRCAIAASITAVLPSGEYASCGADTARIWREDVSRIDSSGIMGGGDMPQAAIDAIAILDKDSSNRVPPFTFEITIRYADETGE